MNEDSNRLDVLEGLLQDGRLAADEGEVWFWPKGSAVPSGYAGLRAAADAAMIMQEKRSSE